MRLILALALVLPIPLLAQKFDVPVIRNHVVDKAFLVDSATENEINAALAQVKRDTGVEMAVLTIQSLEGLSVEQVAMQVAETWKLGTAEGDKGLLLLISKNDRKLRFEVGYGLEGELTDAEAGRIINNTMVPLLKQGDYNRAILTGVVQAIQQAVPNVDVATWFSSGKTFSRYDTKNGKPKKKFLSTLYTVIMWLLVVFFVLGRSRFAGLILGSGYGRRGGFGSGGFGGGGGSFGGGGGFGGGGASGGW